MTSRSRRLKPYGRGRYLAGMLGALRGLLVLLETRRACRQGPGIKTMSELMTCSRQRHARNQEAWGHLARLVQARRLSLDSQRVRRAGAQSKQQVAQMLARPQQRSRQRRLVEALRPGPRQLPTRVLRKPPAALLRLCYRSLTALVPHTPNSRHAPQPLCLSAFL